MKRLKIHTAWKIVIISGMLMLVSALLSCTLLLNYTAVIVEEINVKRSVFSVSATIGYAVAVIATMLFTKCLDKFGLKVTILIGMLSSAAKIFLYAVGHSIITFYIAGVFGGISLAFAGMIPISIIVNNWFKTSRGTAFAIASSCSGIGGFIFSPIIGLAANAFGWRMAFVAVGILCFLLSAMVFIVLRISPDKMGMTPYSSEKAVEREEDKAKVQVNTVVDPFTKREKRSNLVVLVLSILLVNMGPMAVYNVLVPILQDIGYNVLFSTGIAASMLSGANMFGKILMGRVNDRFGTKAILYGWFGLCIFISIYFMVIRRQNYVIALIGVFLVGLIVSINSIPISVVCSQLFLDKREYTRAVSYGNAALNLGQAIELPIFNGIYDANGSYVPSLVYALALSLVSFALITWIIVKNRKRLS